MAGLTALVSIQTAVCRRVKMVGRTVLTAYGKQPVAGDVAVMPLGLMGDEQADMSVHGGLEKAVYAYPAEHYASGKMHALKRASRRWTTACPAAAWVKT